MSILSNNFYYQPLKIDSINTKVYGDFVAKEGDANGRGLLVTLTENGLQKDTTGITLNLKWAHTTVSGLQNIDPFESVDLTKGLYKITYPTDMLRKGKVDAFIQIIDSGKLIGSRNIKINVEATVGDDTAMESSNEFRALASALVEVNSWNARIDAVEADFIQRANDVEATYPQELVSLTSQLEQKADQADVFLKENGININDFDGPTRQTFLEAQGIDVNYILGEKNVKPINTTFFGIGKNKFSSTFEYGNINLTTGALIETNARVRSKDFVSVVPNTDYVLWTTSGNWRDIIFIAEYDANKTFLRYIGANPNTFGYHSSVDAYFIKTVSNAAAEGTYTVPDPKIVNAQLELGTVKTSYEPYQLFFDEKYFKPKSIVEDNLSQDFIDKINNSVMNTVIGKNKFSSTLEYGAIGLSNGAPVTYPSQIRTKDFIEIEPNTDYVLWSTRRNLLDACFIFEYDENQASLRYISHYQTARYHSSADAKYIKMETQSDGTGSYVLPDISELTFQLEKGFSATSYEPYGAKIEETQLQSNQKLKGKVIVNLGDSIFGNYQPPEDISSFIAEVTGATVYNCGFSGSTMAYTNYYMDAFASYRIIDAIVSGDFTLQDTAIANNKEPSHFQKSLELLKSIDFNNVDYLTFNWGTNDYNGGHPIENLSNLMDVTTFKGALRYVLNELTTTYPHIKIMVLTLGYRFWIDGSNNFVEDSDTKIIGGNSATDFINGVMSVSKEYKVPYLDNYYDLGLNKQNRGYYFPLDDGTHPNVEGRKRLGYKIGNQLIARF